MINPSTKNKISLEGAKHALEQPPGFQLCGLTHSLKLEVCHRGHNILKHIARYPLLPLLRVVGRFCCNIPNSSRREDYYCVCRAVSTSAATSFSLYICRRFVPRYTTYTSRFQSTHLPQSYRRVGRPCHGRWTRKASHAIHMCVR